MDVLQTAREWWTQSVAASHRDWAQTHLTRGEYEQAVRECNRAFEIDPDLSEVYLYRGRALYHLGDYQAARADFDVCIQLAPKCVEAYVNRGVVNFALGEFADSMADFNVALWLDPDSTIAYRNRTQVEHAMEAQRAQFEPSR